MTKRSNIQANESSVIDALRAQIAEMQARMDIITRDNDSLIRDNEALARELQESNQTITNLKVQLDEQQVEIERLHEQLRLANCRFFGSSSEQVVPEKLSLFNDVDFSADESVPEPELEEVLDTTASKSQKRKRGGKRKIDLSKFETVVIDHVLTDEERACHQCGHELEEIGVDTTRRLRLVPAHFIVEEHRIHKYRCKPCCKANAQGEDVASVIQRASAPQNCIPSSIATPSLISYVINAKYVNATPLYRMELDFEQLGVQISRQNMANWVINVHERWLARIHERLKVELLTHDVLHADETVVQVLKEPNRDPKSESRMWLFCSGKHDTPVYIYEYHETRAKRVAEDFLRGWSGVLTTDGYEGYYTLNNGGTITNVACLVHIRRKYVEVLKKIKGDDDKAKAVGSIALQARQKIDAMFHIDSTFDDMTAEERKEARERTLRPMLEEFIAWVDEQIPKAVPRLALHEALMYSKKYWPYVMNVLTDGRLVLSNNIAERGIKPFVITRKNFLFSDTPRGAHASAAIFSIVTTARMNGIAPRAYVEWLLKELPNAGELTDEVVDSFLPWSDRVPESFRLSSHAAKKLAEVIEEPIIDIDPESIPKSLGGLL